MRTQEEIIAYVREQLDTVFQSQVSDVLTFLTYENAKEFLNQEMTKETWTETVQHLMDDEVVKELMHVYMDFAWEKANSFRGLSAARSMEHYAAWIWLLGDEAVEHFGDVTDYRYYGKDNLVKICEYLGLDPNQWDDGIRKNSE